VTGSVRLTRRAVGLDEAVPAAVAALGMRGEPIELDVPETLPRAWVDPGLLERAIANVVENALKWSGSRPVRIEGAQRGPFVQVRVIDHGPGVDPLLRDRMFEPFQRLGDHGVGGVGLGLAVTKGFLSVMDGRIDVEDTSGGGTTVVLSVPWVLG
jgi:two-component system sensor histidine kinase KdpD